MLRRGSNSSLKHELEVKFDSKFESGNLSAASRISSSEYWLYMREDTNTHGLRQWYYFRIKTRKPIKLKLRVYKFTKYYSLYRIGMRPYIRVTREGQKGAADPNSDWIQGGSKIKYDYDSLQKCFYLEFEYEFESQSQNVEFAMLPPYTYTMLKDHLTSLKLIFGAAMDKQECRFEINQLGQTLAGLDIPFIEIVSRRRKKGQTR